jgi:hypothetical protein
VNVELVEVVTPPFRATAVVEQVSFPYAPSVNRPETVRPYDAVQVRVIAPVEVAKMPSVLPKLVVAPRVTA